MRQRQLQSEAQRQTDMGGQQYLVQDLIYLQEPSTESRFAQADLLAFLKVQKSDSPAVPCFGDEKPPSSII